MHIELAKISDINSINQVIESAKRYWGYSDELMDVWLPELLLKPEDFDKRTIWVIKKEKQIIAISSLVFLSNGICELEDFWISPAHMGGGIGRKMFQFIINHLEEIKAVKLVIISDPNAEAFYNKMGAIKVDLFASKPAGRMLPIMELLVS
jgi:N-acetylglutamate synthase-like GNAT family acetyltransferase